MRRKLTITVDEGIYDGLHRVVGPRRISGFIESLVRPHVLQEDMAVAYRDMARDEAREEEALDWVDDTAQDVADEPR
jgi:hypothetical protein